MKPVTKSQYIRLVQTLRPMLESIEGDIECAANFSTEFGSVVLMHNTDGNTTMGIVIGGKQVELFDHKRNNNAGLIFWSKRGEGPNNYWSKLEIYDYAMGLAKQAKKEAAK